MIETRNFIISLVFIFCLIFTLNGQHEPVITEAEYASVENDCSLEKDKDVKYIMIQTTGNDTCENLTGTPLARDKCKYLGNVYSNSQLTDFKKYWNQVTPENAGKWGYVERQRDVMNWGGLDSAYRFAKKNNYPFRLHVLIWGNQQPGWIETLPAAEQKEEIEEWFYLISTRYPDIDFIEVVNEPLNDPPNQPGKGGGNYIDALGGNGDTGWDWVIEAFSLARQYFTKSKLMINDYNIVDNTENTRQYINIIELLKARNLIDAIGVQAHAFSTGQTSSIMTSNLDLLAGTGLPIYITEFDIDGPTDEIQLQNYKRIFPVFWEHKAVKGITLWGFRYGLWRTDEGAYLVNTDNKERPAMVWLRDYVTKSSHGGNCPGSTPLFSIEETK
jgi:endo-1,4-beta-xylanase